MLLDSLVKCHSGCILLGQVNYSNAYSTHYADLDKYSYLSALLDLLFWEGASNIFHEYYLDLQISQESKDR